MLRSLLQQPRPSPTRPAWPTPTSQLYTQGMAAARFSHHGVPHRGWLSVPKTERDRMTELHPNNRIAQQTLESGLVVNWKPRLKHTHSPRPAESAHQGTRGSGLRSLSRLPQHVRHPRVHAPIPAMRMPQPQPLCTSALLPPWLCRHQSRGGLGRTPAGAAAWPACLLPAPTPH